MKLTALFKKLRSRQIITVFLAGVLLMISTACSGVNAQGANPNNPAVQAGGANNPYKSGGDGYTNSRMSTDPKITGSGKNQANLPSNKPQRVAAASDPQLLYPGAETPAGRAEKEAQLPIKTAEDFVKPQPGGNIQREAQGSDRVGKRIEKVQEAFKEATEFVGEKANEAGQRPEAQSNPALRKNR